MDLRGFLMAGTAAAQAFRRLAFIAGEWVVINREGSQLDGKRAQVVKDALKEERWVEILVEGYQGVMLHNTQELDLLPTMI
jgi:hypothetical protein